MDTDFLVIGSGLAGLNAALRLASAGRVLIVSKAQVGDGATAYAQGGIASVTSAGDSFAAHVEDTLLAGGGLCNQAVVESVVAAAPGAIERLVACGVAFDQDDSGFSLTQEGGHSARRILHVKDLTGRAIMHALRQRVDNVSNIRQLTEHVAVDLLTLRKLGRAPREDRCLGAYVLNCTTGQVETVRAKCTLLATGGAGKVYLYTSNPDGACGDGVAMALRAGASVANMEFFQFHPTCLFHPHAKSFLISEALRGEGGILRRSDGVPLMKSVHPLGDLAPRDVVARAIDSELKRSGDDCVWLDMKARDSEFIAARFPNIQSACSALGIDITTQQIPVVPAAHYMCGGVWTDAHGATDLLGLWAAGETACTGLHGANRLASNSLLEAAVLGERAADMMVGLAKDIALDISVPDWDSGMAQDPDEMVVVSHNWDELRRTMWNYVGIVRSDKRLDRAATRIAVLQEEIQEYYWHFKLTQDLIELRNLAAIANLIVASARRRRESRGLHYNIDVPHTSAAWCVDSHVRRGIHNALVWAPPVGVAA